MSERRVNLERVRQRLLALAEIGALPGGGVTRLTLTEEDRQARELFSRWCREGGLEVRTDPAGNIIARLEGRNPDLPPLAAGSHLDSVVDGGMLDGNLGSVAALECAQVLAETGHRPRRSLEVIVFTGEESARFGSSLIGSRAMIGSLAEEEIRRVRDTAGISLREALERFGLDPARLPEARRQPGDLAAYMELHIEQGPTLDKEGLPIGLVTGIVGVAREDLLFEGQANHAGTTPFPLRRDALVAAGGLIARVPEITRRGGGPHTVATVGWIEARPGEFNVIPGRVACGLEVRDIEEPVIRRVVHSILDEGERLAGAAGVRLSASERSFVPPVRLDERVMEIAAAACRRLGLPCRRIPSGAGHDAQSMARLCPTGMIFVPSIGGISHAPGEATRWEDVDKGVSVLLATLEALDESLEEQRETVKKS